MEPGQYLPREVPSAAGVLVFQAGRILLTLADQERWEQDGEWTLIPLSGVGGGVGAGEDFLHAAWRECGEELGVYPNIRHTSITYHYSKTYEATEIKLPEPAPLLWAERQRADTQPFAPGLPAGDTLHVVIYRASLGEDPHPVDVPGLCWITPRALVKVAEARQPIAPDYPGIEVIAPALPNHCRFFLPEESIEVDLASFIYHGKIYL